jgi:hypothetical protein
MRTMAMMSTAVLLVAAAGMPSLLRAEKISIKGHGKDAVEGKCNDGGGTYFAPSKYGVYGCLSQDGSGIVCGGTGKDAKTCDSWGPTPNIVPRKTLPTRAEVRAAERKQASTAGK